MLLPGVDRYACINTPLPFSHVPSNSTIYRHNLPRPCHPPNNLDGTFKSQPFTLSPLIFLFPFIYSPHFPFPFPIPFLPSPLLCPAAYLSPPFPSPIPFFCVTLPLNQPKRHRVTMKTEDRHHAMPSVHRVLNRGYCKMSLMPRKEKKKRKWNNAGTMLIETRGGTCMRTVTVPPSNAAACCCSVLFLPWGEGGKSRPSPCFTLPFCLPPVVPFFLSLSSFCLLSCACLCSPFCQCGWSGEPLLFSSKMQSRQKNVTEIYQFVSPNATQRNTTQSTNLTLKIPELGAHG